MSTDDEITGTECAITFADIVLDEHGEYVEQFDEEGLADASAPEYVEVLEEVRHGE